MRLIHENIKISCDACGLQLNSEVKLQSHIQKELQEVECSFCEKLFAGRAKASLPWKNCSQSRSREWVHMHSLSQILQNQATWERSTGIKSLWQIFSWCVQVKFFQPAKRVRSKNVTYSLPRGCDKMSLTAYQEGAIQKRHSQPAKSVTHSLPRGWNPKMSLTACQESALKHHSQTA